MTEPTPWSLDELVLWHSWGCLNERLPHVADPRGFVFPEDPEAARDRFQSLKTLMDSGPYGLIVVSCLAAVLAKAPAASDLLRKALLEALAGAFPSFESGEWEKLAEAPWTLIPVVVDARPKPRAVWFAVGTHDDGGSVLTPPWWSAVADDQALRATAVGGNLLHKRTGRGLCVLPVVSPCGPRCLFGPSLSLPLYLAAWGLQKGRRPEHMTATGTLDEEGVVGPVSALLPKARAAHAVGRRALICPNQGLNPEKMQGTAVTLLPVGDVELAEYLWQTFHDQTGSKALSDFQRLSAPEELAHTVHLLDPRIGRWSGFRDRYRATTEKILRNPEWAEQVLERLAKIVRDPHADPDWIERLLEPWDARCFEALAEENPLAAFQAAQTRWAAATRRGDPEEARQWAHRCESVQDRVLLYPEGIYKICDFLNRRLVSERHALYRFDPELPEEVWDMVRRLEEERLERTRDGRKPAAPALGKLYGTIAQNYGFCGPKYLENVRQSVSAAQDAFGCGRLLGYRADWHRQFHYRLYAELDAEDWNAAQETLWAYAPSGAAADSGTSPGKPFEIMSPYEHAALARYLADTGTVNPAYSAWAVERMERPLPGHPWSLWLWNVGRIFQKAEPKRRAWWQSAELSLRLGATAHPMALLPLAWLWCEGMATASQLEPYAARVMDHLDHGPLWRPHFQEIFGCGSTDEVLDTVLLRASSLFPFTYR